MASWIRSRTSRPGRLLAVREDSRLDPHTLNSARGRVWPVDDTVRLDRFLILGSEGGSYYSSERTLSLENAEAVVRAIDADGPARRAAGGRDPSEAGRAPRTTRPIFFRRWRSLPAWVTWTPSGLCRRRCRASAERGMHLLHFAQFVEGFRGWGRGLRRAVAAWYTQPADRLAYQAIKYGSRDGRSSATSCGSCRTRRA